MTKSRLQKNIVAEFDKQGVTHFVSKLPCGDYMSLDNARFAIDRKQNLLEVCNNVCQDHTRFINELKRATEFGIRLVFLIEHSRNIRTLDDVQKWKNPRLKESPLEYEVSSCIYHSEFIPSEEIKKFCEDLYADYWEWLYDCGKRICTRVYLWADGFYKACNQLGI